MVVPGKVGYFRSPPVVVSSKHQQETALSCHGPSESSVRRPEENFFFTSLGTLQYINYSFTLHSFIHLDIFLCMLVLFPSCVSRN